MNSKRLLLISAAAVAVIIAAIALIMIITGASGRDHGVKLPEERDPAAGMQQEEEPAGLVRVEVSTDTVKSVVRTLRRPEEYSRELSVTSFWHGGSSQYRIESFVSKDASRINIYSEYDAKSVLLTGDTTYIWYGGEPPVYSGSASAAEDEYQMLVTYEDILSVPDEDIRDAGYTRYNDADCVFAEYVSGQLGYVTKCYISTETGLAVGAEKYDGDMLIYSMNEVSCAVGAPSGNVFALPDGTVPGRQ
ncbi:MAG: hypothetical protein J5569_06680 [Oscillospiraceae bacterium]|nr:hypothetical protein [Oscillospiraceae bacterium]